MRTPPKTPFKMGNSRHRMIKKMERERLTKPRPKKKGVSVDPKRIGRVG